MQCLSKHAELGKLPVGPDVRSCSVCKAEGHSQQLDHALHSMPHIVRTEHLEAFPAIL